MVWWDGPESRAPDPHRDGETGSVPNWGSRPDPNADEGVGPVSVEDEDVGHGSRRDEANGSCYDVVGKSDCSWDRGSGSYSGCGGSYSGCGGGIGAGLRGKVIRADSSGNNVIVTERGSRGDQEIVPGCGSSGNRGTGCGSSGDTVIVTGCGSSGDTVIVTGRGSRGDTVIVTEHGSRGDTVIVTGRGSRGDQPGCGSSGNMAITVDSSGKVIGASSSGDGVIAGGRMIRAGSRGAMWNRPASSRDNVVGAISFPLTLYLISIIPGHTPSST